MIVCSVFNHNFQKNNNELKNCFYQEQFCDPKVTKYWFFSFIFYFKRAADGGTSGIDVEVNWCPCKDTSSSDVETPPPL